MILISLYEQLFNYDFLIFHCEYYCILSIKTHGNGFIFGYCLMFICKWQPLKKVKTCFTYRYSITENKGNNNIELKGCALNFWGD